MTQKQDWLMKLEEAQGKILEGIELLQEYIDESGDRNTEVYVLDHLRIIASNDHGFMSHDKNLDDVIESVRSGSDDEVGNDYL